MHDAANVARIQQYINSSFVRPGGRPVGPDESLLDSGMLDSVGIAELIVHLEMEYGIRVTDEEIIPDNFETVERVAALVDRKRA